MRQPKWRCKVIGALSDEVLQRGIKSVWHETLRGFYNARLRSPTCLICERLPYRRSNWAGSKSRPARSSLSSNPNRPFDARDVALEVGDRDRQLPARKRSDRSGELKFRYSLPHRLEFGGQLRAGGCAVDRK